MNHLLLILSGGLGVPAAVALIARALVDRHGDPAAAEVYLTAHRADPAGTDTTADVDALVVDRPKELTA
jgi:hypothetical protein